jgi:hypothetical protein
LMKSPSDRSDFHSTSNLPTHVQFHLFSLLHQSKMPNSCLRRPTHVMTQYRFNGRSMNVAFLGVGCLCFAETNGCNPMVRGVKVLTLSARSHAKIIRVKAPMFCRSAEFNKRAASALCRTSS